MQARFTRAEVDQSAVVVVDVQPSFMQGIHEADRVVDRSTFLLKIAALMSVPILATEQYPERMGGTDPRVTALLPFGYAPHAKMCFSCAGSGPFMHALETTRRKQVLLVGIETHICVTQTALDLLDRGYRVGVCADAVGARSLDRHKIGLKRLRDAGVTLLHSESVAYEWMQTADHPDFRRALAIVKEHSA